MRKYGKTDSNHSEIVAAFRTLGCSVVSLASLGGGVGDALVGFGGFCICVEIKDGSKPPSARRLTPDQERFRDTWKGGLRLVKDLSGVEETVRLLRSWHLKLR